MVEAARKYNCIVQAGLKRRLARRSRGARFVRGPASVPPTAPRLWSTAAAPPSARCRSPPSLRASTGTCSSVRLLPGCPLNRFHYGWHYFWDTATTEVGNSVMPFDVALGIRCPSTRSGRLLRRTLRRRLRPGDAQPSNATFEYATAPGDPGSPPPSPLSASDGCLSHSRAASSRRQQLEHCHRRPTARHPTALGVSNRLNNVSFQIAYKPGPPAPRGDQPEVSHFQISLTASAPPPRGSALRNQKPISPPCAPANISRTGRKLVFDPASSRSQRRKANQYLTRVYRQPLRRPRPGGLPSKWRDSGRLRFICPSTFKLASAEGRGARRYSSTSSRQQDRIRPRRFCYFCAWLSLSLRSEFDHQNASRRRLNRIFRVVSYAPVG
jgi:hypothetical protein